MPEPMDDLSFSPAL